MLLSSHNKTACCVALARPSTCFNCARNYQNDPGRRITDLTKNVPLNSCISQLADTRVALRVLAHVGYSKATMSDTVGPYRHERSYVTERWDERSARAGQRSTERGEEQKANYRHTYPANTRDAYGKREFNVSLMSVSLSSSRASPRIAFLTIAVTVASITSRKT